MIRPTPGPRVPLITLPNWVKSAAACGFNIESVFADLGVEADLLHVESATIASRDLERIMAACVARSRHRHFPFVLGQTFAFEYLPDLETFLTTSPTLRESARVFEWLRLLVNPYLSIHVHETGDRAELRVDEIEAAPAESSHWFAEATLVSVLKFGRALLRGRGDFLGARFRHARPAYAAEAAEVFGLPLAWGQPEHALTIDRRLIDLRLDSAFEQLHRQAEQRVVQRLSERPAPDCASTRLEHLMELRPALLGQGVEAAAQALELHPRTLQRRLAAENLAFADVQSRVRERLARAWLAEPALDIETISERLGFSDRRSFTRAFQRWTGQSPSAFRQR